MNAKSIAEIFVDLTEIAQKISAELNSFNEVSQQTREKLKATLEDVNALRREAISEKLKLN